MNRLKFLEEAEGLLKNNNLRDWKVELRAHTGQRVGGCHYRTRIIALNAFFVEHNDEALVLDNLKHEVAHALTPGHKHNHVWKAAAIRLGCRFDDRDWKGWNQHPGKYKAVCPTCKAVFYKYRKPKYIQGYYCPKCGKEHGRLQFQVTQGESHEERASAIV